MSTITLNNRTYQLPATWNDLDLNQLLTAYQIVLDGRIDRLFPEDEAMAFRRIELARLLLELDEDFLDKWKQDAGEDQFYAELQAVSREASAFAFEEKGEGAYQIALTRTRCPYPTLEHQDETYHAPADALENVTLYELGMSFMKFEAFMKSGEPDMAAELLAILYRPAKPATEENLRSDYEGDIRLPLLKHETTIQKRKELFKRLPTLVSQVLVFWFACCRQAIVSEFPNIFRQDDSSVKKEGNDYAWAGVILNLAEGIVHADTVSNTHYATALTYLSMLEDRRKEIEFQKALTRAR